MEENDVAQLEMTSKQLADVFGLSPITISSWVNRRGLKARKPMGSRKLGLRIKVKDVRAFISTIAGDDPEVLLGQLDTWLNVHGSELVSAQAPGVTRTKVLESTQPSHERQTGREVLSEPE